MLVYGTVKYDYIVELNKHEIALRWNTSENGNVHQCIFQSSIKRISKIILFLLNSTSIYKSLCDINVNFFVDGRIGKANYEDKMNVITKI